MSEGLRRSKRRSLAATPENLTNLGADDEVPPQPSQISERQNLLETLAQRRLRLAQAGTVITVRRPPEGVDDRKPIIGVGATFLDRSRNATYTIIGKLGAGSFGNVFTASTDGSDVPTLTVKRFFIQDFIDENNRNFNAAHLRNVYREGRMHMEEAARKEFAISRVIRRRSDNELCEEDIVCALHVFKVSPNEVCITFPFFSAVDLDTYIKKYLYGSAGEPHTPARSLYVGRCFIIIIELLEILAKLFAIKVVHSDVKPGNILVTRPSGKLRLIDFGLGSNLLEVLDPADATNVQAIFSRAIQFYDTTQPYKDPASAYVVLTPQNEEKMYEAFTVFACGIVVQQLFDADWDYGLPPPYVRETAIMPEGVWPLIRQMTMANVEERLSLASYAYRFQILKRKFERTNSIAGAVATSLAQQQQPSTPT